jgi:dTDP-4-dehydrorhamnose reductase
VYGSARGGDHGTNGALSTMVFPRTILVTGSSGTLGSAFVRLCGERGLTVHPVTRSQLDVTSVGAIEKILHETRAWAIVNAAGYVRVDDAEADRRSCRQVNVEGAANVAAACAKYGVRHVMFSSDLVFDGNKGAPYVERDRLSPLNTYGETKAEAERRVLALCPNTLIVRTAALFGLWDNANCLTQTLAALTSGVPHIAADDLRVSPTFVPDLVNTTLDLLIDSERGVWHLANVGAMSWAELARRAASLAGLDASLVQPRPHRECNMIARRPAYSVLGSERGSIMPSLENALERFVAQKPWLRQMNVPHRSFDHTRARAV